MRFFKDNPIEALPPEGQKQHVQSVPTILCYPLEISFRISTVTKTYPLKLQPKIVLYNPGY
jgi:hypothetical protein